VEQRSTQPDSTQHRQFNVGDRVRIVKSSSFMGDRLIGATGWVEWPDEDRWHFVRLDEPAHTAVGKAVYRLWVLADELEAVQ